MVYIDIDKEILYWIEQFGYEWVDCGQLIEYIKDNYVKEQQDVVIEFIEYMEIKASNLDNLLEFLDWDRICQSDNDYAELGNGKYLNIYRLESDSLELKRLDLIK